jgi:hypothetical protein
MAIWTLIALCVNVKQNWFECVLREHDVVLPLYAELKAEQHAMKSDTSKTHKELALESRKIVKVFIDIEAHEDHL